MKLTWVFLHVLCTFLQLTAGDSFTCNEATGDSFTYDEAEIYCLRQGKTMATLYDIAREILNPAIWKGTSSIWLPIRKISNKPWTWIDGKPYVSNKNNGLPDEDCKHVEVDIADMSEDYCNKKHRFICEGKCDSNTVEIAGWKMFMHRHVRYWISPTEGSWYQAIQTCQEMNMTLAVRIQSSVSHFIGKIAKVLNTENGRFWVGLQRKWWMEFLKGVWKPVSSYAWGAGEPSFQGENAIIRHKGRGVEWHVASSVEKHGVLCVPSSTIPDAQASRMRSKGIDAEGIQRSLEKVIPDAQASRSKGIDAEGIQRSLEKGWTLLVLILMAIIIGSAVMIALLVYIIRIGWRRRSRTQPFTSPTGERVPLQMGNQ